MFNFDLNRNLAENLVLQFEITVQNMHEPVDVHLDGKTEMGVSRLCKVYAYEFVEDIILCRMVFPNLFYYKRSE